ncbi:hypothetical protein TWF106_009619 [Orbilia oligospora]|uniref:Cyanovirin-N domain-containing protein n=1 Tax=Orbilia oligospora TaxID=2813651 RepID=A0A6G1MIC6_ORBOL|nr:hypothetical protein TWF106_009619 [Orbilia oligospora]KAF3223218.1 hypothetical protein TWF191_006499 [Orbilia oligospora]KAF3259642.1 hypothetical protein TWF192_010499 [Orbilia oligospora]
MRSKQFPLVITALWFWAMFSICFGSETVPRAHSSTLVRRAELTRLPESQWTIGSPRQACRVGLYTLRNYFLYQECARWEGIPLSTDEQYGNLPFLDGVCYRLTELIGEQKPAWFAGMSGIIIVQGYCNCKRYTDDMCGRGLKTKDIKVHRLQNMIAGRDARGKGSIECFKDTGRKSFESCSVKITDGIAYPSLFNADEKGRADWEWEYNNIVEKDFLQEEFNERTGQNDCTMVADGGISPRSWEVKGCTCHFYTDDLCQKRYITYGGKGVRRVPQFDNGGPQKIKSIRCDLPWTYDPMSDKDFHKSLCANLRPNGQFPNYQTKPFR